MKIQIEPMERQRSRLPIFAVSRTLPPGFTIPAHSHCTGRLIYGASGTMTILTPESAYVVPPTRALWVPPGQVHSPRSADQVEQRSLDLAEHLAERLPSACRVIAVTPLLREIILRLAEIGPDYLPGSHASKIAELVPAEIAQARTLPLALPLPDDPRLSRLCEVILKDPSDASPLAALGREVGASARTLTRLFRQETAMSFVKWRQQARLMRALALLAKGHSVTEAAMAVGYESPSAFIRLHRRLLGTSPRGLISGKRATARFKHGS